MNQQELETLIAEKERLKAERKAIRAEKKKQRKQKRAAKAAQREKLMAEMKQVKVEIKAETKQIKQQIKTIKETYRKDVKEAKAKTYNSKADRHLRLEEIKEHKNDEILILQNKKIDLWFDFGKKYNTLGWNMTKWWHGVRKEFYRIIWSSPGNTFKYLVIVIVIVLLLSGIFMLINLITENIIK